MNRMRRTLFNNEKGLTLVEVLASIVILSIILISVLMILLQTAKTNKASEEIIDATYVAQVEMENIYDVKESWLEGNGYHSPVTEGPWEVYRNSVNENYVIEVSLQETNDEMTRVLIKVFEGSNTTKPKAQMENLFDWSAN